MAKEKKTVPQVIGENVEEGKKILFEYVRAGDKAKARARLKGIEKTDDGKTDEELARANRKIGLLVSTSKGTIGWSMCKKSKVVLLEEYEIEVPEEEVSSDRIRFGVMDENDVIITKVSKFRVSPGDKFSFERAFVRALRCEKELIKEGIDVNDPENIPNSIRERAKEMLERSNRYFK